MNRFLVPLIGFVVLVGLFWFTLNRMNQGEYNPRDVPTEFIGRAAPAINVPDLMNPGKTVRSSDYLGAPWLFNVWGTWCPECWREHEYHARVETKTRVVVVVRQVVFAPLRAPGWDKSASCSTSRRTRRVWKVVARDGNMMFWSLPQIWWIW